MSGIIALYLFMLAGIAGYVLIARVPSILHTPLMSGSNFIHGVVLAGAMVALGHSQGFMQTVIGFVAVVAASANAVGGYVVSDRMLALFEVKTRRKAARVAKAQAAKTSKETLPAQVEDDHDDESTS